MLNRQQRRWLAIGAMLIAGLFFSFGLIGWTQPAVWAAPPPPEEPTGPEADRYVVLGWNDLGMHCYNWDFSDLAVLPPYNTLWVQVIKVGDPPQIVTTGITVSYGFAANTYSVGKSNFWTYATQLFGVNLPPNTGLKGKGLAGPMDLAGDHFVAEGIPLTEFNDSAPVFTPTNRVPYQLARIVVRDLSGNQLAENTIVAPVSTEMSCDRCHYNNGPGNEGIATGKIERNILSQHDHEAGTHLMNSRPVLCAACHSSNALGAPGQAGLPSLSNAMHRHHAQEAGIPATTDGCYYCHPGPTTHCLRDAMSSRHGMTCISCHGTLAQVALNPNPWLNEPRCDNASCHGSAYQQTSALYRFSKEHGGVYCEACHDSTHAIAPSTRAEDAIKFIALQGHSGTLNTCTVCHATAPAGPGPHGIPGAPQANFLLDPSHASVQEPGANVVYAHVLKNAGTMTDTYTLTTSSSNGWASITASMNGTPVAVPGSVTLGVGSQVNLNVTVHVPASGSAGLVERTVITVSSTLATPPVKTVTDTTLVPKARYYLPLTLKQ